MNRWSFIAVSGTVLLGLTVSGPLLSRSAGLFVSARQNLAPQSMADILRIADQLDLIATGDPPRRAPINIVFLAEEPITAERQTALTFRPDNTHQWLGVVVVHVGSKAMYAGNFDPAHPDRCAVWGDSFVYGDPALIRRLVARGD